MKLDIYNIRGPRSLIVDCCDISIGHSNGATGRVDSGERYFLLRSLGTLQEARS